MAKRTGLSGPDYHWHRIAVDTVRHPLKGKFLGGPNAEEAERDLREHFGYSDADIRRLQGGAQRNPAAREPKVSQDFLAKIVGVSTWADFEEANWEYVADARMHGEDAARAGAGQFDVEITEKAIDAAGLKAEEEAAKEVYRTWEDSFWPPAEALFAEYNLEIEPTEEDSSVYQYFPSRLGDRGDGWSQSANLIRELVNGVGMFHFDTLEEFLESGPYTPEEAVINHIGWLSSHYEVYGNRPARRR